ncbi:MAG: CDP-glycerol glycerophosphotransferase family protein [Vicinamibacterales bacterium]
MTNLVQDTVCRQARRALIDLAHRLDDGLARVVSNRRRVLFEAASPLSVAVARPLLDRLHRDERLEIWCTATDESWDAAAIFRGAPFAGRVISSRRARWMKFDLYVNTDFWNMTWLPRRTKRVHLFHGVAGKYGLDAPVDIAPTIATFDRLFFPNADRLDRYVEAGLIDPVRGQRGLIGYPKVDCLVDGSMEQAEVRDRLGLSDGRPTVLYAPTWSPYSSLNAHGETVIQSLLREDLNVIVKLHDRSYGTAVRGSGGVDWRRHLSAIDASDRLHVATEADISPYLVAADLLVTDHSSAGFEFMLLDRPIVVLACPALADRARISPHKLGLMRRAAEVADHPGRLPDLIRRALASPSRLGAERRSIAAQLFHDPGRATARATLATYGLLELEPPAAVAIARPSRSMAHPAPSTRLQ